MTAGWWPWKSATSKECVRNNLQKVVALKMDAERLPRLALEVLSQNLY